MIRINRLARPRVLKENALGWREAYILALSAGVKEDVSRAESKYRHEKIKAALQSMHFKKCAFCESLIEHVSHSHIEHFKPKSKFPTKTFQWSNLLLACGVCNGKSYKSDHFPSAADGGPLVNPSLEDPSDFFTFRYDVETGTAWVDVKNSRGEVTERTLGLNRTELVIARSQLVKKIAMLKVISDRADTPDDLREKAMELLREACQPSNQYSAFAVEIAR